MFEKVEMTLVPSGVLHLTTQADDTKGKGTVPQRPKDSAKLQRARETC